MRIITLECDDESGWTVRENGRFVTDLCTDEAMAQIVKLLSANFPGFPMLTLDEYKEREHDRAKRMIERKVADAVA